MTAQQAIERRRGRPGEQGEEEREAQAEHQRMQDERAGVLQAMAA